MKRTSANTGILLGIKKQFNTKIYKHALAIYNESGEVATLEYLLQFYRTGKTIEEVRNGLADLVKI